LDQDAIVVLGHFKPALEDLFQTLCYRDSKSVGDGGKSVTRSQWKADSKTRKKVHQCDSRSCSIPAALGEGFDILFAQDAPSQDRLLARETRPHSPEDAESRFEQIAVPISYDDTDFPLEVDSAVVAALAAISAGASTGGMFNRPRRSSGVTVLPEIVESDNESDQESEPTPEASLGNSLQSTLPSTTDLLSPEASLGEASKNASPKQLLFEEQFEDMCKELRIVPELVTRREALSIFRRGQNTGTDGIGLSSGVFMDVVAECAITAYSKPPYGEVYASAHEKIYAFLMAVMPSTSRDLHERFLYSRSRR
jgi:hypothetical protein